MTLNHDETDAEFVELMAQIIYSALRSIWPPSEKTPDWAPGRNSTAQTKARHAARQIIEKTESRAHAAPRTVQAGVTDEQVEAASRACDPMAWFDIDQVSGVHSMMEPRRTRLLARMRAALEAAASAPTRKAYAKGDWWVVGKGWTSADHITKPDLMPLSVVLQTPEPASPATCSCGGGALQPIKTAPKDGSEFVGYESGEVYRCNWLEQDDGEGHRSDGWWDHTGRSFENPTHWMPISAPPGATPSTPCACYRAGLERAAEIAEGASKIFGFYQAARAIASDIRRAGEEGMS